MGSNIIVSPEDFLVSRFNLYKGKYCIFAGAGISVDSGIPLATVDLPGVPSIVSCIRSDFYQSLGKPRLSKKKLIYWFIDQKLLQRQDSLYSDALNLIGDTPRSRQHYLRKFFEGKKPSACHTAIAKLVEHGHIEVVFTTNFDSLIEDAIRNNGAIPSPKIAAHSESIADVLLTEPGPKIAKLHGDYLFSDIKNTAEETEELTENMRSKMRSILNERGLVVVGYSGSDDSIMLIFEQLIYDSGFLPYGLYWLHLKGHKPRPRVASVVEKAKGKLIAIDDGARVLSEVAKRVSRIC